MKVGFGNVSTSHSLAQLRLIVPIINSRQNITSFDVLPLLDGFCHNLSQDFCADNDVFVAGGSLNKDPLKHTGDGGAARPTPLHFSSWRAAPPTCAHYGPSQAPKVSIRQHDA